MASQEVVYRIVLKREDEKTRGGYRIVHRCYTESEGISNVEKAEPVKKIS